MRRNRSRMSKRASNKLARRTARKFKRVNLRRSLARGGYHW